MKKLFLIFIVCVFSLYSIMFSYADFESKAANTMSDLPLALKFEPSENLKVINNYYDQLEIILAEQRQSLNTLNYIYYLGSYNGSFDGSGILHSLKWDYSLEENAPLFNSDIYKGYYSIRTEKPLKQYQTSEVFDYPAFNNVSRPEFDSYIKGVLKDQNSKEQLVILMQSKLIDKLVEMGPDRTALLDEILSLRQTANNSKSQETLFQLFESRVRLQLYRQMVEMNKQKLEKLIKNIGIVITADRAGELLLQSKDAQSKEKAVQIINVLKGEERYRGLILLNELYSKENYKLSFKEENGSLSEIELERAIAAIAMDEKGFAKLDLEGLLIEKQEVINKASVNTTNSNIADDQLKSLELLYMNKTKAAQVIIKELNRYSIYLELKDKKISNYYTRSFEEKQKLWKKDLDSKLNAFGIGGMADFMAYIKQFELLDRQIYKVDREKAIIAKFRNYDMQFRKTAEGSLWITNMLFMLKYIQ